MAKALVYSEYGDADVLSIQDWPVGEPGPGQVRVQVKATAVNPLDWKIRQGLMSGGKPLGQPTLVGRDLAGVIDAVGEGVAEFAVGDRVAGNVNGGTSAEYVLVKAGELTPLPDPVDFVTGSGIGVVGTTAIRVLTLANVSSGQTVLIHGATGGVGAFATQLAIGRGATVIGTTGEKNLEFLRSLGAIAVAYGEGWVDRVREAAPGPIDAVIDTSGHGVIDGSLELVVPGGPIVTIADFAAKGPGVVLTTGGEPGFEHSLADAVQDVANGLVSVPIEATFPLEQGAEAHRLSETGHARGKIVLTLD